MPSPGPETSCFERGDVAGAGSGGDLERLAAAAGRCAAHPGDLEVFYDGAGHTFAFDLDHPDAAAARVATAIADERARTSFLRGIFLSWGRRHALDPEGSEAFATAWPIIPAWDRHFGIANGMAWGLASRPGARIEDGFAQADRLGAPIRSIYLEELGWQQARLHAERGGRPGPGLADGQPIEKRCVIIHGIVRNVFSWEPDLYDARRWLVEQPDCRVHVLHALQHAENNRGKRIPGLQELLDTELGPDDAGVWQSLETLP